MNVKKSLALFFASILMLSSISVSATELPEYFSSVEGIFAHKLPGVQSQEYPDCWSYSAMAALEFSAVYKDHWAFSDSKNLFSEHHMAAALNKTSDPLYEHYTRNHESGGNREMATAYFARELASGPVLYEAFDKEDYEAYRLEKNDFTKLFGREREGIVTKSIFLTSSYEGSSILIDGYKYQRNEENIEKLKQAIMEYGAITASYYSYEQDEKGKELYYNSETAAYCVSWEDVISRTTPDGNGVTVTQNGYTFIDESNHSINIVGWDDNYSYENFLTYPKSFDGEFYSYENGAWIVKNNWGTEFGDEGYEYISFMDPFIGCRATAFDIERMTDYKICTYVPRGIMGTVKFLNCSYGEYTANRFYNESGMLTMVGLYMCDEAFEMEILIDPEPGESLKKWTNNEFEQKKSVLIDAETGEESLSVKVDNPGYYVYKLKNPVKITGDFDMYMRCLVPEKTNINQAVGKVLGSTDPYTENVSFYAGVGRNGESGTWKAVNSNWAANAYITKEAFEVPDIEINSNRVTAEFTRFLPYDAKAYLVVYTDEIVSDIVSCDITESKTWLERYLPPEATSVRAFIWQGADMAPYENYKMIYK